MVMHAFKDKYKTALSAERPGFVAGLMTALIFPSILYAAGDYKSALAGSSVAIILAFLNANLMLVVFGSILGVFLWGMI